MGERVRLPDWARDALPPRWADDLDAAAGFVRQPAEVMRAESFHVMAPTRLSFANTLVRRMTANRWRVDCKDVEIAEDGTGFVAYEIEAEGVVMHFGAFSYPPLPPGHQRMFRDTKVEFFGALVDGPLDVDRLRRERAEFDQNLWRGRTDSKVYGWTVASRSGRNFDHVVEALADGRQPDPDALADRGGYIIRNGGFYGNGRLGTRAWRSFAAADGPLARPYHVDLFCLYLWRLAGFEIVDAAARAANPRAAGLAPKLKRYLGVGNSSGLGTVAALARWPARLSAYMVTRELAFGYVRSRRGPLEAGKLDRLESLLARAEACYRDAVEVAPALAEPREHVMNALRGITDDVRRMRTAAAAARPAEPYPWIHLLRQAETHGSREAAELLQSLLLELYPEVDAFGDVTTAGTAQECAVIPQMRVSELRNVLESHFDWVLALDLNAPGAREFFWYRSEENGENRRGERSVDVGVDHETFIDVPGAVRRLYDSLDAVSPHTTVATFLLQNPEHALAVARAQLAPTAPFGEIRESMCGRDFLPSDGIRCFLTVLGLELPSPNSSRWVRGVFYRGAPLPADLATGAEIDWILPLTPGTIPPTDSDAETPCPV
ncbi:MAG: hypothetical protein GEU93_18710 [Propionibacteriales bacterium]|nr:hypothetical protein [Propionibacteriales bacterium]